MNALQEQIQTWYASRTELDQKVLFLLVLVAMVLVVYWLIWAPLARDVALQSQRVSQAEQDLHWLYEASAEVQSVRGENRKPLEQILVSSLRRHQLQPDSNKYDANVSEWRLRFRATDFRKLLLWLNELRRQSTVVIALANISREPAGGVNARFVLTENR